MSLDKSMKFENYINQIEVFLVFVIVSAIKNYHYFGFQYFNNYNINYIL